MPALIITDRSMPIMDGVEFCRQLKRERGLARTPVILTSADTSATGAEGLWNEFLVKPVLMDVLLASVQRLLTSATDGREAED
jgi:CheY-like chemotaxis protein